MKTLLSVGCSNTVGVNLEEEIGIFNYLIKEKDASALGKEVAYYRESKNFTTKVAQLIGYNSINLGISGASNERIVFNLIDHLTCNPKPDLILVNLSGRSRVTFQVDDRILDFDLTYTTEHLKTHSKIEDKNFVPFIEFFKRNSVTDYNLYKRQDHLYRYVVLFLESTGIPYLLSETINTGQKLTNYTDKCITTSFDDFNISSGRNRAQGNHWLSDSHTAWAEHLVKKLEDLYGISRA